MSEQDKRKRVEKYKGIIDDPDISTDGMDGISKADQMENAIKSHCKKCFSFDNQCENAERNCEFYQFRLWEQGDKCDRPGVDRMDGNFIHGRLCDECFLNNKEGNRCQK